MNTRLLSTSIAAVALILAAAAAPPAIVPAPAPAKEEVTAALPVIPDKNFNFADYKPDPNYKGMNTDAFKKAIADITAAGGGHLIVPAGMYKTLPITLTSHMDLHLEAGAMIKAPETFAEYGIPDPNDAAAGGGRGRGGGGGGGGARALISAANVTDVSITGTGTIDGSGAEFWIWSDKAARRYPPGRAVVGRPSLVTLNGQRILVDGVTLSNSPQFHLVPRGSDITIQNVRIFAPSDAPNTDAMDPGGQRIVIRKCHIDTGDDDVAMQAGSRDILIEDLTILHGHGISIGSGTRNGLSHMIVRRCTFDSTDNGLRIKSYRGNGGEVHDIQYSDITMINVRRPFDINMLYNGNTPITLPNGQTTDVGPRDAAGRTTALPNFYDIHVSNLTVTKSPVAGRLIGIPELMPNNITFTNCKFDSNRGFLIEDAKDITFDKVEINALVGDQVVLDNASIKFNGTAKSGNSGGPPDPFYPGN